MCDRLKSKGHIHPGPFYFFFFLIFNSVLIGLMPLPFGLKAPSKGTLIFSGIAGALSGIIYTSNKNAEESRRKVAQRVAHLADRPCGVHVRKKKNKDKRSS